MSGAGVILKSANFQKDLRRFVIPLTSNLSKVVSSDEAEFTADDIGRTIVGEGFSSTIAAVNSATQAVLTDFPVAPAVNVVAYMAVRPAGAGWALYGDGTMEVNVGGKFRGTLELAGFTVGEDGTVTIGVGDSKMTAHPNGNFTWGAGGARVGITPEGEFFAGGEDINTAIFTVDNAGNVTIKETSQSLHSIPIGALNTTILPPVFDPPGGAFATAVDVGMASQTANVKIYYTDDGSAPDDSDILYTGARIHLTATTTVKAIAYIGPFKSAIATQTFTLDSAVVPNPQADPVEGTYSPTGGTLNVTITDLLAGSSIRYTTDGTTTPSDTVGTLISPASGAVVPSATIQLAAGTRTLKMIAFKAGKTNSGVVTEVYTITSGGGGTGGGSGGGRGNVP
jgi:hypothetical protein